MKRRRRIFSIYECCFIFTIIIIIGILFATPFLNYNNQALLYFLKKEYGVAEEKWLKALSQNSFSPFYRMNLALNHILLKQSEKAIQEYQVTRNLIKNRRTSEVFKIQSSKNKNISSVSKEKMEEYNQTDDILFYSLFNSAVSAHQKGEINRVLSFYQEALHLRPSSLEVKTNIELLIQNSSSSGQSQKDKKDESSSRRDGKDQKNNQQRTEEQKKESEKQDETEGGSGNKEEKKQADEKNKKQSGDKQNKTADQGVEDQNKESKDRDFSENQDRKGHRSNKDQNLNPQQTESILKAILDQERKIRERRHQERKKPVPIEKDW